MRDLRLTGALVPHAPVLLDGITRDGAVSGAAARIRAAAARLDLAADLVVVVSPHGRGAVHPRVRGTLAGFGIAGVEVDVEGDPGAAGALAEEAGLSPSDDSADHGAVVAVALARPAAPTIVAALPESTGPGEPDPTAALAAAERVAAAILSLARDRRVCVLASAHTGAGLGPRAPLTELPASIEVSRRVLHALADDVGSLVDLAAELAVGGGSCSAGVLAVVGATFAGAPAEILAYEEPVGVGYPVARLGRPALR